MRIFWQAGFGRTNSFKSIKVELAIFEFINDVYHASRRDISPRVSVAGAPRFWGVAFHPNQRLASFVTFALSAFSLGLLGSKAPPYQAFRSLCSGCFGSVMASTNIA